ncbi:M55 family metallopeptidase [candidate division WOR-3 bacterium]|nr:M55 family metallopeptidase [candidate division WOR-3 bacterium]
MRRRFNAFISFDIEGISGVSSWNEVANNASTLHAYRKIATAEVNAAIRGIKAGRPKIGEILVCDSHAQGENLIITDLEPGVTIIKGSPRRYYMVEGIDRKFNILFCIGYHAMVGSQRAGMDHTYSSSVIYNIMINGRHVGETEINAAVAGYYGVPLGLVSGDDVLATEVRSFFGRTVAMVITKYGISRFSARCRLPSEVHAEIEKKAAQVVSKSTALRPFRFKIPIRAEFELMNSAMGDAVEPIPGVKRMAARTCAYNAKNILEFYNILRLICALGRLTQ